MIKPKKLTGQIAKPDADTREPESGFRNQHQAGEREGKTMKKTVKIIKCNDGKYVIRLDDRSGSWYVKSAEKLCSFTGNLKSVQIVNEIDDPGYLVIDDPELSFEISEIEAPLDKIIREIEKRYPGWKFSRTEARYQSCIMAIFTMPGC